MQKKEQEVYFALHCKHSSNNIFVTKKYFFRNEHKKIFFDPHVSCRPTIVTANQHIFKSGLNYINNSYS